ncbi:hypothetical protein LCGC14_0879010 [marine sediment metagenome]|uniref:Uncharacterized protein n=1 Tax=marine sediment metagenome TaxID=412755 RepID=A0A0F9S9H1_9ZZZZ
MGIYILLNRYYFQTRRGRSNQFKERRRIIEKLLKSNMFYGFFSPVCYYLDGIELVKKEINENETSKEIFLKIKEIYNKVRFDYFEFSSKINLYHNDDLDELLIPVKIKVRKLRNIQGHITIEFDSEKSDFNDFFIGSEKYAVLNKKNIIGLIKSLNQTALGTVTYLFKKVNIGKNAFPFENVKVAFFFWRNRNIDAYKDVMMFREQVRKELSKVDLKKLSLRERNKNQKYINELIKPYDLYYIPSKTLNELTINLVLKHTHLLDDYFQSKALVEQNSYSLQTPSGSDELLFPILYEMNLKINQVFKLKIPKKSDVDELMTEGLFEVFKDKTEYFKNLSKRKEELLDKFNNYYQDKLRKILTLTEDWDENDSTRYNIVTLTKSKIFVESILENFLLLYNIELDLPRIFPGINSDIDVEWKNEKFQLLISFPEKKDELAGLYGDNFSDDVIKYDFKTGDPHIRLLAWLKRQI